jgi:ActR/RegA family two-component response regulator
MQHLLVEPSPVPSLLESEPFIRQAVLLVEPDDHLAAALTDQARGVVDVHRQTAFAPARAELLVTSFAFLITNLRLRDYNGLHLVYLAVAAERPTRAIVYTAEYDLAAAREVQRAGAFYETREGLTQAMAAYLKGTLPGRDCRNPTLRDRRTPGRVGGRRGWDSCVKAD